MSFGPFDPFGPPQPPQPPDPFSGMNPFPDFDIYIDINGGIHLTPEGAISENQRIEADYTRGASGGCNQDPTKAKG
jgi:hypothetical protein